MYGVWGAERAGSAELLWGFKINITGHVCLSPQENVESPLLPFTIFYCQASFSTSWHQLLMDFLVSLQQPAGAHPPALHGGGVNWVLFACGGGCHLCSIHCKHCFLTVLPPDECGMFIFHVRSRLWEGGRRAVEPKRVAEGSLSC